MKTLEIGADSLCFDHEDDGLLTFDPTPWLEFDNRFIVVGISGGIEHHDATLCLSPLQVLELRNWLNSLPGLEQLPLEVPQETGESHG